MEDIATCLNDQRKGSRWPGSCSSQSVFGGRAVQPDKDVAMLGGERPFQYKVGQQIASEACI